MLRVSVLLLLGLREVCQIVWHIRYLPTCRLSQFSFRMFLGDIGKQAIATKHHSVLIEHLVKIMMICHIVLDRHLYELSSQNSSYRRDGKGPMYRFTYHLNSALLRSDGYAILYKYV